MLCKSRAETNNWARVLKAFSNLAPTKRRRSRHEGLVFDDFDPRSAWVRERARIFLPPMEGDHRVAIYTSWTPHPSVQGVERGPLRLRVQLGGQSAILTPHETGTAECILNLPSSEARDGAHVNLALLDAGLTNTLAWLGRVTAGWPLLQGWQRFRVQNRNRQLRILRIEIDGEIVFDFSQRHAAFSAEFARRHVHLGINVVGFLTADLGVGESARCMVRAADATGLSTALVPLRLNCKNSQGDQTYGSRLQETNPHPVNVIHLDPPAMRDVDHHHGTAFRTGKYNIGYWAWELPEFPDGWINAFEYVHEVWCPSEFVREAIAAKSPVPVLAMPHTIQFNRPTVPVAELRRHFDLPASDYLFLVLYDLNSYSERKNPRAAIEAFRRSGLAGRGAALVIKVHNVTGNESDLATLRAAVADLPATTLLTETLPREDVSRLQAACDCFVSLHRSEGFGLAVAECMYLGKPVIATDWSATAEFLNAGNGAPVRCRLVPLERSHGPYGKGQTWADPDIAHAAEWMQRLASDRTLGEHLGAEARRTIEERFSPETIGTRYRRRLEVLASW